MNPITAISAVTAHITEHIGERYWQMLIDARRDIVNRLDGFAKQLETGVDGPQVAQQIRSMLAAAQGTSNPDDAGTHLSKNDSMLTASWLLDTLQDRQANTARHTAASSAAAFKRTQQDLARLICKLHPELEINIPREHLPPTAARPTAAITLRWEKVSNTKDDWFADTPRDLIPSSGRYLIRRMVGARKPDAKYSLKFNNQLRSTHATSEDAKAHAAHLINRGTP